MGLCGLRYLLVFISYNIRYRIRRLTWNKVKNSNEKPVISIQGGLAKSNLYVNLIQAELKSNLDFEYKSAAGDHLIGAPIVGNKYPDGVTDLLKWWRA